MLRKPAVEAAALTWLLAFPVLIGLAAAVRAGPVVLDAIDPAAAAARSGLLDVALDAVDFAGSLPVWGVIVLSLSLAAARTSPGRAAEVVTVSVAAEAAATAIKALVGRARPAGADVADLLVAAGFPSGHVTRTAVLVGVLLVAVPWACRRRRLVLVGGLVAVAVMGAARVSSSSHYTSDVIGGALLAALVLAAWQLLRVPLAKLRTPGSRGADPRASWPTSEKTLRMQHLRHGSSVRVIDRCRPLRCRLSPPQCRPAAPRAVARA